MMYVYGHPQPSKSSDAVDSKLLLTLNRCEILHSAAEPPPLLSPPRPATNRIMCRVNISLLPLERAVIILPWKFEL